MSYYESAKGKRVTYARAIKELTRHGLPLDGEDRKEFDPNSIILYNKVYTATRQSIPLSPAAP